ncbi:MAG: hypothetical protein L6R19_05730 [Alphaproteobacteria bacterium]|jgi:hypothetical protein|nr:hypothetical protein [Alphaproteobacteria bacterium]
MGLTVNLNTARWELQVSFLWQIEYWPVLVRWKNPEETGFLWKFLCFVVRFGKDHA